MDTVTYRNQDVVAFLRENFILVHINVANRQQAQVAHDFSIRAVPTMVVLRGTAEGHEEIGRNRGYLDPQAFLTFAREQLRLFRG